METHLKVGKYQIKLPIAKHYNPPIGYDMSVNMAVDLYNQMPIKTNDISRATFYKYIRKNDISRAVDHHGCMWFKSDNLLELFEDWVPKEVGDERR